MALASLAATAAQKQEQQQAMQSPAHLQPLTGAAEQAAAEALASNDPPNARQVRPPLTAVVQGAHAAAGTHARLPCRPSKIV